MGAVSRARMDNSNVGQGSLPSTSTSPHRQRPLRVLFVHRDSEVINLCLQELRQGQFLVTSDSVASLPQCPEQICGENYDVILIEYAPATYTASRVTKYLQQRAQNIPLIFLTSGLTNNSVAKLSAHGVFDFVEHQHIGRLPMVVRRTLNDRQIREELEEAKKALRHSQSLYRALVDNPAYGIYRCGSAGELLEVNQALTKMLGYESSAEMLSANQKSQIFPHLYGELPDAAGAPEPAASNRSK